MLHAVDALANDSTLLLLTHCLGIAIRVEGNVLNRKGAGSGQVEEEREVGQAAAELRKVESVRPRHTQSQNMRDVADVNVWSNVKADLRARRNEGGEGRMTFRQCVRDSQFQRT